MQEIRKFFGKLSPECLAELDRLLLKLKEANKANEGKRVIKADEIAALPEKEYTELWGYLRHCCHLVASWPNKMAAIRMFACKREMSFKDVQDEVVDCMTIHCYTYAWRHYEHSEDPSAYVLSTAKFGWRAWVEEQNNFHCGVDRAMDDWLEENPTTGHKVCNLNFGT